MAEGKARERASVTGQRDQALLTFVRYVAEKNGTTPLRAAGAILELICVPAEEPTYAEEHAVAILKAAISPPRRAADDEAEDDGED